MVELSRAGSGHRRWTLVSLGILASLHFILHLQNHMQSAVTAREHLVFAGKLVKDSTGQICFNAGNGHYHPLTHQVANAEDGSLRVYPVRDHLFPLLVGKPKVRAWDTAEAVIRDLGRRFPTNCAAGGEQGTRIVNTAYTASLLLYGIRFNAKSAFAITSPLMCRHSAC